MFNYIYGTPDKSFFDSYWAGVHFSSGLLLGIVLLYVVYTYGKDISARMYGRIGISVLILWEYFEVSLRYVDRFFPTTAYRLRAIIPESIFAQESIINLISDLVLGSAGLVIVYQIWTRRAKKRSQ